MDTKNDNSDNSSGLSTGTMLAQYRIEHVLGQGGFGITYLAYDTKAQRHVVIKENLPAGYAAREPGTSRVQAQGKTENFQWAMENFIKEARTLSSLDHPSIVKVYRAFEANGTAYFVMDYIEGQSLDLVVKSTPWSELELLEMIIALLDALHYLHGQNIQHRDIKPANIMLNAQGQPLLIDFGTAKQMFSELSQTVIASAGYTPAEQMSSRGNTGPWSDIYALGACCYKLITGEKPIPSLDRVSEEIDAHIPLRQRPESKIYTRAFCDSIDKALQLRPAQRWQSAQEWKKNLSPLYQQAIKLREQSLQPTKSSALPWVLLALVTLVFAGWISYQHLTDEKQVANQQPTPTPPAKQPVQPKPAPPAKQPAQPTPTPPAKQPAQPKPAPPAKQPAQPTPAPPAKQPAQPKPTPPAKQKIVATNATIRQIVKQEIQRLGVDADLNHIDVSQVTDMSLLFYGIRFNGDISQWDVSNVTNIKLISLGFSYTGDISKWRFKKLIVGNIDYLGIREIVKFELNRLGPNANLNHIDVSRVTDMRYLFEKSDFNGDISKWDVSQVTNMDGMFRNSKFNRDISQWDVSKVTNMYMMFGESQFNGDISQWNVSNVTDMSYMFSKSQFNGDISQWNVSKVTNMFAMFSGSQFSDYISQWNVSKVTNMGNMFFLSQFNGDISQWDVSKATDMSFMLWNEKFAGDISSWKINPNANIECLVHRKHPQFKPSMRRD